jgi:hypothetical protein
MQKIYIPDTGIVTYNGINTVVQLCTTYTEDSAVVTPCTLEPMPALGSQVVINHYYLFNGDMYKCRQTHNRTANDPLTIPALFSFYRINSQSLEWKVGEQVELGWERIFNGVIYQVIQAHQTQSDWTPVIATTLWKTIDQRPATLAEWAIGVAYKVNDLVTYQGKTYKCLQAHTSIATWNPAVAGSLWKLQ